MDNNIDQLETEVRGIQQSLNELKDNIKLTDIQKRMQAEELNSQAESTRERIENEIRALESATDEESKKKRKQAEGLLDSLTTVTDFYNSIKNNQPSTGETLVQKGTDDRNIFTKATDWLGEQWDDVTSGKKWKEEPGKNIFRVAGVCLTGYAIYKGVKSLWNRAFGDDEKEQGQKEEKGKEGESFGKTGWGNFLKWTGIATATGGGAYGFSKLFLLKKKNLEIDQEGGDTISDAMFQQLLNMEGDQDFVAKCHKKRFGENFVTGPYGMVYKHIDNNGNLLDKPVTFKNGERVSKDWAEKNARAYYNKRAKEWANLLKSKGYKYTQNNLDALVSASGGTTASVDYLKEYVTQHRDNKQDITNFLSTFATTAAGNGEVQPGLVTRRKFESNRFQGIEHPYSDYQRGLYA